MTPKLSPPIELSVSKISPDTYQLGSLFLCKKFASGQNENPIVTWKDEDGDYCLVESAPGESQSSEAVTEGLIYQAGMSSAVWTIGSHAICKVKTWCEGMEMESSTLAFIANKFPHIPGPNVLHSWLDKKLNRTFLILRRVRGQTLERAWSSLTTDQKEQAASTVAQYCRDLAGVTSQNIQSATGCGVLERFLNVRAEETHPTWKPRLLGPLSRTVTEKYLHRIPTRPTPFIGNEFHFYHADLGPTNILLSDDGFVKGNIGLGVSWILPKVLDSSKTLSEPWI